MSYLIDMDERAKDIHQWAIDKGFYDREVLAVEKGEYAVDNPSLASEKLMLIVTEVAEAQEALRDGDRENEAEEVADILIRTLDYAAWRGINPDIEVRKKMARNRKRPYLHGREF